MMLAGLIHVPLALPVLAAFAARLVWLLACEEAQERGVDQLAVLGIGRRARVVSAG